MMKKFSIYIILYLLSLTKLNAQLVSDTLDFFIAGSAGYGWYNMQELREMNTMIHQNTLYNTQITSQMPSYFNYNLELNYKIKSNFFGVSAGVASTGSRTIASDQTGVYKFDMEVSSMKYGIVGGKSLSFYHNRISGDFVLSIGALSSKLKTEETTDVYSDYITENYQEFRAANFYIEPSIRINIISLKYFYIAAELGYLFQFGGSNLINYDDSYFIKNDIFYTNPDGYKAQWDGLRVGVVVVVAFRENFFNIQ